VIVEDPGGYDYAMVSLTRREAPVLAPDAGFFARIAAPYEPLAKARWERADRFGSGGAVAEQAWRSPALEFFRWFAAFPVVYRVEREPPHECVWFQDLRFLTPGRETWPFRYGACRDGAGPWRAFGLEEGRRAPLD
jgi:inner membrane protein